MYDNASLLKYSLSKMQRNELNGDVLTLDSCCLDLNCKCCVIAVYLLTTLRVCMIAIQPGLQAGMDPLVIGDDRKKLTFA